jgi:hypothetical protein
VQFFISDLGRKIVRTGYALGNKLARTGALGIKTLDTTARKANHTLRDINAAYDSSAGRKVRNVVGLLPGGGEVNAFADTVCGLSGKAEMAIGNARSSLQKSNVVPDVTSSFAYCLCVVTVSKLLGITMGASDLPYTLVLRSSNRLDGSTNSYRINIPAFIREPQAKMFAMQCLGVALDTNHLPRCVIEVRVAYGNIDKTYDTSGGSTNMVAPVDIPATHLLDEDAQENTQSSSVYILSAPVLAVSNRVSMTVITVQIRDALTGDLLELQGGETLGRAFWCFMFTYRSVKRLGTRLGFWYTRMVPMSLSTGTLTNTLLCTLLR